MNYEDLLGYVRAAYALGAKEMKAKACSALAREGTRMIPAPHAHSVVSEIDPLSGEPDWGKLLRGWAKIKQAREKKS